jgi:Copper amine oxidase, enzyme domain
MHNLNNINMNLKYSFVLLSSLFLLHFHTNASDSIPEVQLRRQAIIAAVKQPVPLLLLSESSLNTRQRKCQQLTLNAPSVRPLLVEPGTQQPLLNEVFQIYALRPSDYAALPECADGSCMRVEIYQYATNTTIIAVVQPEKDRVVRVGINKQTQPDLPNHLRQLALDIACASPEVEQALGFKPLPGNALMADTKTALNRTRCERSRHLCVAPTFVQGEKALWSIVDLTDLRVAGVRWTQVGGNTTPPTERRIQNANITECYCEKMNTVERDGWKFNYILTNNDGIRISEVDYRGERVIDNAKLVDWHVSYSNTDGFGYSDAVGCPFFSTAAVLAIEAPRIGELIENGQVVGFALIQNYASEGWPGNCNYNYEQRYEFYTDGRFRPIVASLGRGCGNNGTYRPVSRIVLPGQQQQFKEWNGTQWKTWDKEGWQLQTETTPLSAEGWQYQVADAASGRGFAIEPNRGQLNAGGRPDNAYLYVTLAHPELEEGHTDLLTIGPCCNTDYRQGPEKFIEPRAEAISGAQSLVLWYVAQIKNDDRKGQEYCWAEMQLKDGLYQPVVYPCYSGPMFVPLKK